MAETSEPEAARIMLGVVFFNPTIGQIEHSMRAASAFGSSSFIFNGPSKHPQEVATLKSVRGTNLICNVENLGIAFAINQLIDIFLVSQQHDLLLILDQDTEINIEILGTAIKVYGELSAAGAPCFALCAPLNESKSGESNNYPEQDCGGQAPRSGGRFKTQTLACDARRC